MTSTTSSISSSLYTFKVCFDGDVRRFSFQNEPTFIDLVNKINDLFHPKEQLVITYLDEVGDNITISQQEELDEAYSFLRESNQQILRLSVVRKSNFNNFINNNNNSSSTSSTSQTSCNFRSNNVGGGANGNNNSNAGNNNGLDNLFVSLLSNQFVQQMIPQVINNLASNPALMTSLLQTTSLAMRHQTPPNTAPPLGVSNNFHTSLDAVALLNQPSPQTLPMSLQSTTASSSTLSPNSAYNNSTSPTHSLNAQNNHSNNTTNSGHSPSSSPGSSTYSSLDAKSFEEISNSPKDTSPIASQVAASEPTTPTKVPTPTSTHKPNATMFSVPKIFNQLPFSFASGRGTSTAEPTTKKDETTNIPIHVPQQVQYITPQPYQSPVYPPPPGAEPIRQAQQHIYPVIPNQLPPLGYHPGNHVQPQQQDANIMHTSSPLQTAYGFQPQQQQQQQNPYLHPQPPSPQPISVASPSIVSHNKDVITLMDALRVNEHKANELLAKYKGNAAEAMIMESTE
ncbi:hypothetical protein SAMD00019534_054990 [Acytostelium subglobosum LB1]|uniref:hypothetical protein n=1 Tax=Acytostelium subglobosum LB1 TaxID=1410327 RepID=UPI00064502E8|nr:hypothetical protein SAMD00019534_054990 [Acytostelium subglobosum LB1]GAM22324.1 hypothetical protein SAMD00019534_054990 [Acytostelium subglobosum LB1]|eukprot:XP_012754444.1 hypothetical protein SAMD00019534_054990 [Acytostelium subglobosum LB1]